MWAKDTNFDNVSQYLATIPTCQPQMGSQLKPAGQRQCWSCLHAARRSEALVPHGCWQCHAPWGGWLWGKGSDIRQYHEKGLRQNSSTLAHWHFGPGNSWWWRVALCTAGSSSLASTHPLDNRSNHASTLPKLRQSIINVSRYCQVS